MIESLSDVSVSIVTFNNADIIKDRLTRLLTIFKNNQVADIFIVDNYSTDGTRKILQKIAEDNSRLKLILLNSNKGFGFGHNQAIKKSVNKYHIVMNLDATPKQKNVISNMKNYMDENLDVDLLSPLVLFPNGMIQHLTRSEPTVFDLAIRFLGPNWFRRRQENFMHLQDGYDHEQVINNATGSFMFLRLSTLKNLGGFDERYFLYMEDTDLTKSINAQGKAIFSPKFEVIHEWQRSNHSLGGAKLMIISMYRYFNKWGWRFF